MKIPVNLFKSWNCDLIFWGKHLKWINLLLHLTCLCNGLHINNCHLAQKSDAIWSQIAITLSLACKYQVHKSIIVNCTCLNSYLGSDLICGPMGVGIAHIFTNILLCTWYYLPIYSCAPDTCSSSTIMYSSHTLSCSPVTFLNRQLEKQGQDGFDRLIGCQ